MPVVRQLPARWVVAVLSCVATSLALAPPAPAAAGAQGGTTELRVTVRWGAGVTSSWQLTCDPPGGTHPQADRACARLAAIADPFAPLPSDVACTMIYGGPERARVVGQWHGSAVDATFARTNGCEIAQWAAYRPLFTDPRMVLVRGRVDLGPTCPVERPDQPCETHGADATVTATSTSRSRTAPSGSEGFVLLLPRRVWDLTADAGMTCRSVRVDLRHGPAPGPVVITCDTGIR